MSNANDFVIEAGVLMEYTGPGGDVVIPEGVTSIGNTAFSSCSRLTSITIPEGVTSIGWGTFKDCSSLTRIKLPNSVTSIGIRAFDGCSRLTSIMIPEGVASIGWGTFWGCSRLTSIMIPVGVTSIGDRAFTDCSSLTSIMIPDSLTSIGDSSFEGCQSLRSITIPERVTSIGWHTFKDCNSLSSFDLKSSKCKIEDGLFGDEFPAGLIPEIQTLYQAMTVGAISRYVLVRDVWDVLLPELQYDIYMSKQGKSLKYSYQKCVDEKQVAYIAGRMLEEFDPKAQSAVFAAVSIFMTSFSTKIPNDLLVKLYEALKSVKKAGKAMQVVEADQMLMELIRGKSLDDSERPEAEQIVFRDVQNWRVPVEVLLKEYYALKLSDLPILLDRDGIELDPTVTAYLLITCEKEGITVDVNNWWDSSVTDRLKDAWTTDTAKTLLEKLDIRTLQTALASLAESYLTGAGKSKKMYLASPICRFADELTMQELTKRAAKWKTGPHTYFFNAVMFSDTKAAAFFADRFRLLDRYAALWDTDEETIRDTVMVDTGLDENGQKTYDLGNEKVIATLKENLTIELFDVEKNKVIRTLSKKDIKHQLFEATKRDIRALRTSVKKIAKKRTDMLLDQYLSGKTITVDSWKKAYRDNPVLRMIGSLLVWEQEGNTFISTPSGLSDCNGQVYLLTEKPIRIAHPIEVKPDEITLWQKVFLTKGLKQPFEQIWEPAYRREMIKPDRYENSRIKYKYLKDRSKHGISAHIQMDTYDSPTMLSLKKCSVDYEISDSYGDVNMDTEFILGKFSYARFDRQVNHIVYLLDKLTLYDRIEKDDQSIQIMLPGYTVSQVTEFIHIAQKANAVNVLALLLDYKNAHFADFDPMDEFTLDLI